MMELSQRATHATVQQIGQNLLGLLGGQAGGYGTWGVMIARAGGQRSFQSKVESTKGSKFECTLGIEVERSQVIAAGQHSSGKRGRSGFGGCG